MISKLIKNVLEDYGVNQKMVDKVKSIVDNIDITESDDQIEITINIKNVRLIITKENQEEKYEGE